ncbi:rubrerythrin family protein [Actinoallomurus sp. NBC_01490]|uniref:rubrerythrin family protein n=1 Tax=Actinoallomurus sp. NBC_01490 TaxID=2903557 RepID=UPI002E376019|nr:ferritin family protein [Actinoallomurus sp. NBC_01490]
MTSLPTRFLLGSTVAAALSVPLYGAFAAAATGSASAAVVTRTPSPQTRADLAKAMRGEAFANASYRLYADQARREGLGSVADLFERTAATERDEHFAESAAMAGLVGTDAANLRAAISGEHYEANTMYPKFARQATEDGDANAADRFSEVARDEGRHEAAFRTALGVVETGRGTVPAAPDVTAHQVPAGPAKVHADRTKTNLDTAMHGEAEAYAKYHLWGEHATDKGDPDVGRLFKGTGEVERQEHFAEHAELAGLVGSTRDNLSKAIAGERYESTTMYPTFAHRAEKAGDTDAARMFSGTATDEGEHARAFEQARDRLDQDTAASSS